MSKPMIDWGKLTSQGRAKAPGISWSDKEAEAVALLSKHFKKPMSEVARYVRKGILTVEAYAKAQEDRDVVNPYLKLSKEVLLKKVQALEIAVSPDASVELLAQMLLEHKQKQQAKTKAKKDQALAKAKSEKIEKEAREKAKKEAEAKAKEEAEKKEKEEKEAKAKVDAEAEKKKKEAEEAEAKKKEEAEKKAKEKKAEEAKKAKEEKKK